MEDRLSSITATSMISHGVDVDRLNIMNFSACRSRLRNTFSQAAGLVAKYVAVYSLSTRPIRSGSVATTSDL